MHIVALCTVYEDDLLAQRDLSEGETFVDAAAAEFSWLHDSGIVLDECHEITNNEVSAEYQAFIWNTDKQQFEPIGRSVGNMLLCQNRYKEKVKMNNFPKGCDPSKYKFCKRNVYTSFGEWESAKE